MSFKDFVKVGQVIRSKKTSNVFVIITAPRNRKTCDVVQLSKKLDKVVAETALISDMVTTEYYETVSGKIAVDAICTGREHLEANQNRFGAHIVKAFTNTVIDKIVQWGTSKDWFFQAYRLRRMNKTCPYPYLYRFACQCYRLPVVTENLYSVLVSGKDSGFTINKKARTVSFFGRETKLFNY